jgi:hypothetical protein
MAGGDGCPWVLSPDLLRVVVWVGCVVSVGCRVVGCRAVCRVIGRDGLHIQWGCTNHSSAHQARHSHTRMQVVRLAEAKEHKYVKMCLVTLWR